MDALRGPRARAWRAVQPYLAPSNRRTLKGGPGAASEAAPWKRLPGRAGSPGGTREEESP